MVRDQEVEGSRSPTQPPPTASFSISVIPPAPSIAPGTTATVQYRLFQVMVLPGRSLLPYPDCLLT